MIALSQMLLTVSLVASPARVGDAVPFSAQLPQGATWVNVREPPFNAKGDGVTDDTAAIEAAIIASGPGGSIHFPRGQYLITRPLIPKTAQTWSGESGGDQATMRGSLLRVRSPIAMVMVPPGTERLRFNELMFWGSNEAYIPGSIAVLMEGPTGPAAINNVSFANCSFWKWDKAVVGRDRVGRVGSFQVSNVRLDNVKCAESHYCLWMESSNADYWMVDNSTFSVVDGGAFVWIERGGDIGIRNTTGYGLGSTASMLAINGGVGPILLERCQAESIAYFMRVLQGLGPYDSSITLIGNTVNAPIDVVATANMVMISNSFTADVKMASGGAGDGKVIELGDSWSRGARLVLKSNSRLVMEAATSHNEVSSGMRVGNGANVTSELSAEGVMASYSLAPGAIEVWWGRVSGARRGNTAATAFNPPLPGGIVWSANIETDKGDVKVTIFNASRAPVNIPTTSVTIDVLQH